MQSIKRLSIFVVLALVTIGLVGSVNSMPNNTYGGPCDTAEDNGWTNPGWNAMCYSFMEAVDACCESGSCGDWYCDTL